MSFLPMLITMIINALVALARIQGFLTREETTVTEVRRVWSFGVSGFLV